MARSSVIALLLIVLPLPQGVRAQQGVDLEPIVQVTIDSQRVVVGQQALLRVVVLAPNYLTAPPELPTFQVRNAVTRQLPSVNTSEQRNGMTYAGVRFEFAVYPQEPGDFAISAQKVRIKYAAEPPATREVEITLPRLSFEAVVPEAAASLRPFLSADKLSVEQEIKRSSDQLKAGDAVTRVVTIKAEGTPAMLLPPQTFAIIDGLRLYPAQPELEDKVEGRTGAMTSTRVDSATYMLERAGDFSLPAIDIGWWNVGEGRVEQVHLAAALLKVAANPAVEDGGADGRSVAPWNWSALIDLIVNHWLLTAFALVILVVLAWIMPIAVRRMTAFLRRCRAAYRASEAWSFRQFRVATRQRKAETIYFALLGWLRRFEPLAPAGTIDTLMSVANDPVLQQQIEALQSELFASADGARGWSPRTLIRHVVLARRTLRRRSLRAEETTALPRLLNPAGSRAPEFSNRRVAR
jgi:hypothetical protein